MDSVLSHLCQTKKNVACIEKWLQLVKSVAFIKVYPQYTVYIQRFNMSMYIVFILQCSSHIIIILYNNFVFDKFLSHTVIVQPYFYNSVSAVMLLFIYCVIYVIML